MKEVNESLYKFESEFEKKAKIEKLRYSFTMMIKLINSELIKSINKLDSSHVDIK